MTNDADGQATLHIDIRDGWAGELLSVLVNGVPAFRGEVTTDPRISLAEQAELALPAGSTVVEAIVTDPALWASLEVQIAGEHWVGISLAEGAIEITEQRRLFGYV